MQGLKVARTAIAALALAGVVAFPSGASAGQARHCAPVVKKIYTNTGFYKAKVLIVAGNVSCREARKVLWKALTPGGYNGSIRNGWECMSKGSFGPFVEKCIRTGRNATREVIKTTRPKPCPTCHANRK